MSLRSLTLLLVGLPVALALLFAASDLQHSRRAYRDAALVVERNQLAGSCLQAGNDFAAERDTSNMVLGDVDPIDREHRAVIDAYRASADASIGKILAGVPGGFRDRVDEVSRAWKLVESLRPSLDRDLSRRVAERDKALPGQWLAAADDLVARLESLLIAVSSVPGSSDAGFERLSDLRALALQFRSLAGAEYTTLGSGLASGRAPGREAMRAATLLRGRSLQVWSQIELGTEKLADPDISGAVKKVHADFFGLLRPLQNEIIRSAGGDKVALTRIDRYLAASAMALHATVELADDISRAATAYATGRLDAAKRQEMLSLAIVMATVVLAGILGLLLMRRLMRPLNEMVTRVDKVLEPPPGSSLLPGTGTAGNDLGKLGRALDMLDASLAEQVRQAVTLSESERISAALLTGLPHSVIATDINGLITVFSPGAETMLGYTAEEVVGKWTPLLIHEQAEIRSRAEELSMETGLSVEPAFNVFVSKTTNTAKPDEHEWTYIRKNGTRITVLLAVTTLRNALGDIDGYLGVATDVTDRTLAAARISHMAHYDYLTGLPNRRLLQDRMQVAITRAQRDNSHLALMLIDLDKFKPVNDNLGHSVGDLLLKAVAGRMAGCLRESDTLARVGGDEFVLLLPDIETGQHALGVAEKIRLALNQPFELAGGYKVSIACCIGVAIYPQHGTDEKHLSKNADDAMYAAKELGRNRVQLSTSAASGASGEETGADGMASDYLVWRRSYNCGNVTIDLEHRKLFEMANTLLRVAMAGADAAAQLPLELEQIIASAAKHFADEEAILAQYEFAGLEDHVLKHQKLVGRALELRNLANTGELKMVDVVTFMVQEVVVKHLLKEDTRFFPLLRRAMNNPAADLASETNERG